MGGTPDHGHFGAEHDLSFEDYLSPFAPSASRDASPIPALSCEDGPFVPAEVAGLQPATEVSEVASGPDPEIADGDHIPTASSTNTGAAAEQDDLAFDLLRSDRVFEAWEPQQKYGRILYETKTLTAPDQDESVAIDVPAWRFPGRTKSVALVFGGVHGTERNGVQVVNQLKQQLIKAAERGRRPEYTTVLIPELITARRWKDYVRFVDVDGRPVEPNRNFPSPGESYAVAHQRGLGRPDKAELLDPDGRPLRGKEVTHRMLAETRILIRLIEEENPVRAVSVHAHTVPGTRGGGPGIFVDTRPGLFEAAADMKLAADMVEDAMKSLGATADRKLDLRDTSGRRLIHPFHGNFADKEPNKIPETPTLNVLYTSTRHPPGTSFGGWAPARGITTITSELPCWRIGTIKPKGLCWENVSDVVKNKLVNVHENAILRGFLGGLKAPGQTEPDGERLEADSQSSAQGGVASAQVAIPAVEAWEFEETGAEGVSEDEAADTEFEEPADEAADSEDSSEDTETFADLEDPAASYLETAGRYDVEDQRFAAAEQLDGDEALDLSPADEEQPFAPDEVETALLEAEAEAWDGEAEGPVEESAVDTLETLLEAETGAGSSLADRVRGVAAFVFGPTLRRGSRGPAVAALQRALLKLGYHVAVDGDFGQNTESAVRAFQRWRGPAVTGVVERRTKARLATALALANRVLRVMELLVDQYGYPVNGAAGVVGNLIVESGVLPNRVEGSRVETPMRAPDLTRQVRDFTPVEVRDRNIAPQRSPLLAGIGLAQWTTPSRRDGLFRHTFRGQQLGAAILSDLDAQVDYLVTELGQRYYAPVYTSLRAPGVTVDDAADDFVYGYERPGSIQQNRQRLPRTDPRVLKVFRERRAQARRALSIYRATHPR
jgi:peptidoglycan hydrolase-like protein with peptidoglycan-binding domain